MPVTRREFIKIGAQVGAVAVASRFIVSDAFAMAASPYAATFASFDAFVERYMRGMNAPGMTLVLADRDGVQRIATYGFGDVEHAAPVAEDALFQIGSISKSFLANCLLQLRDEGKLDLDKPIADYLPWLRIESAFAPITVHHLLTHSSGLPGNAPVFLSDPADRHHAANPPGKYFHYNNMAFEALGYLAWTLDGRPLAEIFRKRIFEPLGMMQSEPLIDFNNRTRQVKSYSAFQPDRIYPRRGRLSEAPAIVETSGAGCICSTPRDMGLYIRMLANKGCGPSGRLLSEEGFALLSKAHIKAEEFGPTASYGYGIAVDTEDGHAILKHTGGMVSFASAIRVDLDDGVGAFASINAMQGYRPTPIVDYATKLMRAQRARKPMPPSPAPPDDPLHVDKAGDYVGVYRSSDGRSVEFVADGDRLFLLHEGQRLAAESNGGLMLVAHPEFSRFGFVFGRADSKKKTSPIAEVSWGGDWYVNAHYKGPMHFAPPAEWAAYTGHYRNESPWLGSFHVVILKDRLCIDGLAPLEAGADGRFYARDEEHGPEWIRFADIVNGKAMRVKISGDDAWRVMDA